MFKGGFELANMGRALLSHPIKKQVVKCDF